MFILYIMRDMFINFEKFKCINFSVYKVNKSISLLYNKCSRYSLQVFRNIKWIDEDQINPALDVYLFLSVQ